MQEYNNSDVMEAEEKAKTPDTVSRSEKLGGLFLLVNAVFVILSLIWGLSDVSRTTMFITSGLIDLGIGISLLLNYRKFLSFAKVRLIAGIVIFGGMAIFSQDFFSLAVQLVLSSSILILLFGKTSQLRMGFAVVLFSLILFFYVDSSLSVFTGSSIVNGIRFHNEYTLVEIEDDSFLHLPGLPDSWKMRAKSSYVDINPVVSTWLVDPYKDSHIMVIHEELPSGFEITHSMIVDSVLDNAQFMAKVAVLEQQQDEYLGFERTFMQTRTEFAEMELSYYYNILTNDSQAIQIIYFARAPGFDRSLPMIKQFMNEVTFK